MTNPAINTSQEENDDSGGHYGILFLLLFIIFSPVTILTAVIVYFLFSYVHIKRSVILAFSTPILLVPVIFFQSVPASFIDSWRVTFPNILQQEIEVFPGIMSMLAEQFWLAAPVGILIGLGFASWRWFTRARWQDIQFKRSPFELLKRQKVIKEIENDENTPTDAMTLGIDDECRRISQTYYESSAHTLCIGGSGAGKTNTVLMRVRDQIKHGDGVAIIDLKSDPEVTAKAKAYADRYGRKFQHFTLQNINEAYTGPAPEGNAHYDPLSKGDHTRRADMVLDLREWDSDFYRNMTQQYLQVMFAILIGNPRNDVSVLQDAIELMNPETLFKRAQPLSNVPAYQPFYDAARRMVDEKLPREALQNLMTNRSQLEIYLQSIAGPWLTLDTSEDPNNISLIDAARHGDVVVFSLDSQAYPSLSAKLANLIIQDLKTVSSELLKEKPEDTIPFHVFIDEFSAIGSDNIIGLLNKARAANMHITLATQTLGDLMVKNPALSMQMMGIVSSFIIHRANTAEDAEVFAGLTGTVLSSKLKQNVEYNQDLLGGIGTGIGRGTASLDEKEEWRIKGTQIQALGVGECFFISTVTQRFLKVKVIREKLKASRRQELTAAAPKEQFEIEEIVRVDPTEQTIVYEDLMSFDPMREQESANPLSSTEFRPFNALTTGTVEVVETVQTTNPPFAKPAPTAVVPSPFVNPVTVGKPASPSTTPVFPGQTKPSIPFPPQSQPPETSTSAEKPAVTHTPFPTTPQKPVKPTKKPDTKSEYDF